MRRKRMKDAQRGIKRVERRGRDRERFNAEALNMARAALIREGVSAYT